MFLECNVSGTPALGLQQATRPPLTATNESTMFTESEPPSDSLMSHFWSVAKAPGSYN